MQQSQGYMFKQHNILAIYLLLALFVLFFVSLFIGRIPISISELTSDSRVYSIIIELRLPRIISALCIGVGLAGSGAVYQALFRNPLVSPDILGVTAGCSLGAALALILGYESIFSVQLFSFVFGLASVFIALYVSKLIAPSQIVTLVLIGIIITATFNAFLLCAKYIADPYDELPAIIFWIMGGLYRIGWNEAISLAILIAIVFVGIYKARFRLNILSLGEVHAKSLGVNYTLNKIILITITSIVISLIISNCGQIGWVALVVPHLSRVLVGPDHKKMIPIAMIIGAIMMLLFDDLARSITSAELPISIFTSIIGAPIFGILLIKNRGVNW
ncbi:MAG: iron ABC transporter permease [Gammaproteobacteria bacterium]|nr:MAG: iron ABC transporter permease [Gammaproteobacteria bacterium]